MTANQITYTEGAGAVLDAYSRTYGAGEQKVQKVITVHTDAPTYSIALCGIGIGTSTDHLLQLMNGASGVMIVTRVHVAQFALAGADAAWGFDLFRLTSAGTGGSSVATSGANPVLVANDPGDSAFSGAAKYAVTSSKGTEGDQIARRRLTIKTAQPTSYVEWTPAPGSKGIVVPAGTSNGIAVKNVTSVATATVDIMVTFTVVAVR